MIMKKKWKFEMYRLMDEIGKHIEWSNPDPQKQKSRVLIHM